MAKQADGTEQSFQFTGEYSESDLEALALFAISQQLDHRMGRGTMLAAGLMAVAAILCRSWVLAIAGFAGVIGISLLIRYVILPRRLLRHARRIPGPSGQRRITITEREILHEGEGSQQMYAKVDIQRAVLTRDHLFVLFRPQGLLMLPLAWIKPVAPIAEVAALLARKPS